MGNVSQTYICICEPEHIFTFTFENVYGKFWSGIIGWDSGITNDEASYSKLDIVQWNILRHIIGWRRTDGDDWKDTMKRLNDRLEQGQHRY